MNTADGRRSEYQGTREFVELRVETLRQFGQSAYEMVGVPAPDAAVVVEAQLAADVRGVDTHGFQRLPWYVDRLRKGENNPKPELKVVRDSPVSLVLDCDNALGQLGCVRAMEMVLDKARATGLAAVATVQSNDWGRGAHYPVMAAEAGFICFGTTTSVPHLAPFGSRTRLLGNNPMVYTVPRRGHPPIVLDMALTPVALGKLLRAREEGASIPSSWGFSDSDGSPTTDPDVALRGVIPAIGGYKGVGLSVMMNILAGILPGGAHTAGVDVGKRGQFFLVLSPGLFTDADSFSQGIEEMAQQFAEADLLPGSDGIFLPGEPEERRATAVLERGLIGYPRSVVDLLEAVAVEVGINLSDGSAGPST